MNVNHVIHNDRSRFAVLCITFASLLLVGCTVTKTDEKRGFIYQSPLVSFTCQHDPAKSEWKIDKEAIDLLKELNNQPHKVQSEDDQEITYNLLSLPSVQEFVDGCKKLLDSANN